MQIHPLKQALEALYKTYHSGYLSTDPLGLVHRFQRPEDQEVAGLIAAVFAYGRVEQIRKSVQSIFDRMESSPYAFISGFDFQRDARRFSGFVHRFNNETDLVCLLFGIKQVLETHGSLKALFLEGYTPERPDIGEALSAFVDHFLNINYAPVIGRKVLPKDAGFRFFFPSPRNKSACKRLALYLRWMVRRTDGLDFGLWNEVSPAKLVIPLDTHLFRISSRIGLTRRKSADWAAACEVTQNLRLLDPTDPVKYDFALARLGILKQCVKEKSGKLCRECRLYGICRYGQGGRVKNVRSGAAVA